MSEKRAYLNLGCGSRYHPDWVNIDIHATGPGVIAHDISRNIPLPTGSCDVVYSAAMLEHLRYRHAEAFAKECYRVLKPGGIIRIGVPDLEQICRLYLQKLETAVNGDEQSIHDYNWMLLEMYDQTVRESNGGHMLNYLRRQHIPNEDFIHERIGEEGREILQKIRRQQSVHNTKSEKPGLIKRVLKGLQKFPDAVRLRLLWRLLGPDGMRALKIGRFRLSGEVHQWMYDRYSLAQLLYSAGFADPQLQGAKTSRIPNWTTFHLDTLPDGRVVKPDLFFMEATKPGMPIDE